MTCKLTAVFETVSKCELTAVFFRQLMGDLDRSQHSSSGAEDSGGGGGTVAHAGTHDDFIQRLANLHSRLSASSQNGQCLPKSPHGVGSGLSEVGGFRGCEFAFWLFLVDCTLLSLPAPLFAFL